jgi:PAS domain S-box-containing protein
LGATKTGLDIIDSDYNIIYIDPEWQKTYGDPKGRKCYEYFMGRSQKCPQCSVEETLRTKKPVITEETLAKEGNRPVQVTTIPFKDESGNWLVAEVNVDITARKKNEDALRLSENKIRALFDQTFQFIGMMTPDGRLIEANRTAMQFAGIKESDCIGKFFWDTPWWTHSKEMQDKLREAVVKAASGEAVFFEATHLADDKSLHYVDFSLKPVKDKSGKTTFLIPEGRDITERKHVEEELAKYRSHLEDIVKERSEALAESEEKFKAIFTESTDGMILADAQSKQFFMCNKAVCSMLGYTDEEMKKLSVKDIHPEETLPHAIEVFENQANGALKIAADMAVKRKGGTIFYADIAVSLIYLKGKKYLLGSFRDITQRKAAEAALQISEANYRSIFELASGGIMIRDIETYQTVDANRAATEMFGYSKEEMIGLYVRNFMTNEAPYRWEDAQCFYDKAAAGEPQLFEWLAVDKAGRTFWVEANVKRAVIGNKYRIISMLRDITERKRLDSMKDNFVNSVSHELRTPLAAIKEGVAIVLEEIKGKVGKENRNILGIVKKNVDRLNRLITDVLDFQKIESGLMVFRPKQHNMNDIVMECVRTMMPLAYENKLELLTDLTKKIPKIAFDKDRVLQVLMNIVSNAMKFTKKGSIKYLQRLRAIQ